jgi:hypothetical protein
MGDQEGRAKSAIEQFLAAMEKKCRIGGYVESPP